MAGVPGYRKEKLSLLFHGRDHREPDYCLLTMAFPFRSLKGELMLQDIIKSWVVHDSKLRPLPRQGSVLPLN